MVTCMIVRAWLCREAGYHQQMCHSTPHVKGLRGNGFARSAGQRCVQLQLVYTSSRAGCSLSVPGSGASAHLLQTLSAPSVNMNPALGQSGASTPQGILCGTLDIIDADCPATNGTCMPVWCDIPACRGLSARKPLRACGRMLKAHPSCSATFLPPVQLQWTVMPWHTGQLPCLGLLGKPSPCTPAIPEGAVYLVRGWRQRWPLYYSTGLDIVKPAMQHCTCLSSIAAVTQAAWMRLGAPIRSLAKEQTPPLDTAWYSWPLFNHPCYPGARCVDAYKLCVQINMQNNT